MNAINNMPFIHLAAILDMGLVLLGLALWLHSRRAR